MPGEAERDKLCLPLAHGCTGVRQQVVALPCALIAQAAKPSREGGQCGALPASSMCALRVLHASACCALLQVLLVRAVANTCGSMPMAVLSAIQTLLESGPPTAAALISKLHQRVCKRPTECARVCCAEEEARSGSSAARQPWGFGPWPGLEPGVFQCACKRKRRPHCEGAPTTPDKLALESFVVELYYLRCFCCRVRGAFRSAAALHAWHMPMLFVQRGNTLI